MNGFDNFSNLSKRGLLLFRLLFGPWLFYAIYSAWSDTGVVRWLNHYEATINNGKFHPFITFGIALVLPGAAIMKLVQLCDRLTRRGSYSAKQTSSSRNSSAV